VLTASPDRCQHHASCAQDEVCQGGPSDLLDVAQRAVVGDLGQHRARPPIPAYSESRSSAGASCRPSSDTVAVVEVRQTGVVVKSIRVRTDEKPRLPDRFGCGRL